MDGFLDAGLVAWIVVASRPQIHLEMDVVTAVRDFAQVQNRVVCSGEYAAHQKDGRIEGQSQVSAHFGIGRRDGDALLGACDLDLLQVE